MSAFIYCLKQLIFLGERSESTLNTLVMKKKLVEIMEWDERYRLKLINSISGYKGAHLIGTKTT